MKFKMPGLFHCIILFIIIGYSCNAQKKKTTGLQKPNIIFILADDLGIGDIGAFNKNGKIKTPNIDRLAQEGMRFTDAHTSSSVCTPTRYGIMTGRYNWRTELKSGVLVGTSPALIPKSRKTVAALMQEYGYETSIIGKWHLGWNWAENERGVDMDKYDFTKSISHSPNDLGFDYAYTICASLDMAPYVYVENAMPTAKIEGQTENDGKYTFWRKGPTANDFNHEQVTPNFINRAVDYVKSKKGSKKPFFLYLPLPSPHTPILPTKEFQGRSGINPYADFVMQVDAQIGSLLDTVKEEGIEDNTLIIFLSDNGCSPKANAQVLKEHGHDPSANFRGMKASIFEGGHRVPFIAKWPGVIQPNSTSKQTICSTDFFATCADILNYTVPDNEGEDSYSMLPLFKGEAVESDFRKATVHHSSSGFFAIRKDDWKLILCKGDGRRNTLEDELDSKLPKFQLYNLADDASESKNLYDKNPEKYKELKNLLIQYIKQGRSTPGKAQKNDAIDFEWQQISSFMEE